MAPPARVLALALPLLAAALAGCTVEAPVVEGNLPASPLTARPGSPLGGPGAGVPGPLVPDLENLSADAIQFQAPVWTIGDSWRWNIVAGTTSFAQQMVVYGETPTDYLVATTDPQDAVNSAFHGRSLPGKVNKGTLSGYDQGVMTRYFDFPLQTNKTWTLHVRGTDHAVQANFTRATEGNRGPGFDVRGTNAFGGAIALQYAPSVKWMTKFHLTDPSGANLFSRTLAGHSGNYTGPYYVAKSEDLLVVQRNGTNPQNPAGGFTVGRTYDRLHLALGASGNGAVDLRIVDPTGGLRYNFTASGPSNSFQEADILLPPAGAWRMVWNVAGPVDVFLRVAGVDVDEASL